FATAGDILGQDWYLVRLSEHQLRHQSRLLRQVPAARARRGGGSGAVSRGGADLLRATTRAERRGLRALSPILPAVKARRAGQHAGVSGRGLQGARPVHASCGCRELAPLPSLLRHWLVEARGEVAHSHLVSIWIIRTSNTLKTSTSKIDMTTPRVAARP